EFLALEKSGWKGANGSAIASQAGTESFFRAAITAAHERGGLCFTALRLDGRAIAMLLTLINGKAGFSFKTAFDETYARYSPGVLLQRESLNILAERNLDWIDSCAAQDHPMIDSLWHERRSIIGVSCALPGTSNRIAYGAAQSAKRVWHSIKPASGN
ncbi:MAG: GNAT family N-acetyltransferase, partial [Pseudomonadota bacterium]